MHRYKIPRKVDIEDKVFGNILTLKQMIIIGIGGGVSYVIYTIIVATYELNFFEVGLITIPCLIAIAFAFVHIGPISLLQFSFLFLEFIIRPQRRVWSKPGSKAIDIIKQTTEKISDKGDQQLSQKEEIENLSDEDKRGFAALIKSHLVLGFYTKQILFLLKWIVNLFMIPYSFVIKKLL